MSVRKKIIGTVMIAVALVIVFIATAIVASPFLIMFINRQLGMYECLALYIGANLPFLTTYSMVIEVIIIGGVEMILD